MAGHIRTASRNSEHWQSFQKQQSFKFVDQGMPIDSAELRAKESNMCSVKSLFCCLSVLVGKPTKSGTVKDSKKVRRSQIIRNFDNDDDSFGYNFDDQMSPRVLTRLAAPGHNFD